MVLFLPTRKSPAEALQRLSTTHRFTILAPRQSVNVICLMKELACIIGLDHCNALLFVSFQSGGTPDLPIAPESRQHIPLDTVHFLHIGEQILAPPVDLARVHSDHK